jgi:hypothetical protein
MQRRGLGLVLGCRIRPVLNQYPHDLRLLFELRWGVMRDLTVALSFYIRPALD